jgi:hypothetical protein
MYAKLSSEGIRPTKMKSRHEESYQTWMLHLELGQVLIVSLILLAKRRSLNGHEIHQMEK